LEVSWREVYPGQPVTERFHKRHTAYIPAAYDCTGVRMTARDPWVLDHLEDRFDDVDLALRQRMTRMLRHSRRFRSSTMTDWLSAMRSLATSPIIEVHVEDDVVELTADIMGLDETATLELEVTATTFVLASSNNGRRRQHFSVQAPVPVYPDTARHAFNDGLLIVRATAQPSQQRPPVRRWIDDGIVPSLTRVPRSVSVEMATGGR
jgi:HSP20 family molecular chaperone IbpA